MAISSTQYIDLLVKKLSGVTKTDNNTNKSASNESIASPPLIRGDIIWTQADLIPNTAQTVAGLTQSYLTTSAVACVADITSVPIGGVYPTWLTNLTDWIPTEFSSTWSVKVFIDDAAAADPTSTGTEIFAAGSGGTGQYYFDYQSGVLNFIGETIPSALTSAKKIYVTGYRYVGVKGISAAISGSFGNLTVSNTTIGTTSSNNNIILTATGSGIVEVTGTNGILIPSGSSEQRPAGASYVGTLRFNNETNLVEFYNGANWISVSPEVSIDSQILIGDNSTATFTLLREVSAVGLLVSINGTMQRPGTSYVVSGDEITFDEIPHTGDIVELRYITLGYDNAINTQQHTTGVAYYNTANTVAASVNYTFNPDTSRLSLSGDFSIGNIVLKDDGDNKIGFYQADGITPAIINATTEIVADSIANGNSNLSFSGANGSILANVGGVTTATITSSGIVGNITGNSAGTHTGAVVGTSVSASAGFTGNVTGDVIGNLTGNSGTATKWITARTLSLTGAVTGSVSVDGSGNVSLATTATSDPVITLSGAITGTGTMTNLGNVNITTTATNDPTITLAGDLTGSVTLTNLASGTLTATIAANSVALGTDTTGNYVGSGATSGNGISGSNTGEGGTFTVTSNATSANTANTIVFRDASGNFSAGTLTGTASTALYADLAEKYSSDFDYEPGTVVEFGGDAEVTASGSSHSVKVAGIVSTNPAYLMNAGAAGVSVALVGRVPCKVNGIVEKGDRLVASDIPGVAMTLNSSMYQPGCIIGKALESSAGGITTIEVVVGSI
tara:strand:- start:1232 stop:3601 length:2370 start_codon:yes stop_codon:yes gene_type:complete